MLSSWATGTASRDSLHRPHGRRKDNLLAAGPPVVRHRALERQRHSVCVAGNTTRSRKPARFPGGEGRCNGYGAKPLHASAVPVLFALARLRSKKSSCTGTKTLLHRTQSGFQKLALSSK